MCSIFGVLRTDRVIFLSVNILTVGGVLLLGFVVSNACNALIIAVCSACVYVCMYVRMYVCTYVLHIFVCTYVYMYVRMYALCMYYACMYVCVCIFYFIY